MHIGSAVVQRARKQSLKGPCAAWAYVLASIYHSASRDHEHNTALQLRQDVTNTFDTCMTSLNSAGHSVAGHSVAQCRLVNVVRSVLDCPSVEASVVNAVGPGLDAAQHARQLAVDPSLQLIAERRSCQRA